MSYALVKKYLLELELEASSFIKTNELKKKYLYLAKMYHPDLSESVYKDGKKFIILKDAYDYVLNNIEPINDYFFALKNASINMNLYDAYIFFYNFLNIDDNKDEIVTLNNRIEKLDSLFDLDKSVKMIFDVLQIYSFYQRDQTYDIQTLVRCACSVALNMLKEFANTDIDANKILEAMKLKNLSNPKFDSLSQYEKLLYSIYEMYIGLLTYLSHESMDINNAFKSVVDLSLLLGYKEFIPTEQEIIFKGRKYQHLLKADAYSQKESKNKKSILTEIINLGSLSNVYKKIIIFDTETSGLNPLIDEIIEIAMIVLTIDNNGKIIKKEEIDEFVRLSNDKLLSDDIVKLTGITDEILRKHGKDSYSVITNICSLMFDNERIGVFAYNAGFDLSFLYHFFKKANMEYLLNLSNIDYYDCLTAFKDRATYPHKLVDAIKHYNLQEKVQNSHRAIDDALATLEVLKSMIFESDDIFNYVNIFGFNPKYPIKNHPILKLKFLPQPYNVSKKIYE